MSKMYGCFADPSLAERAAGALLDYGVQSEDISLVRCGCEDDYRNWQATRANAVERPSETQAVQSAAPSYSSDIVQEADSQRIHGQFLDRSDPKYAFDTTASDVLTEDPHYRAAEHIVTGEYVENRLEMDRELEEMENRVDLSANNGITTTTPADAEVGAAKGAGIGLGLGILAALASIFLPGFGFVVGGGALAMAIAGAVGTAGAGAIAGAVTGYLKDQGMDERLAANYEQTLSTGGALLEVNVPSGRVTEEIARELLAKYGAANISACEGAESRYMS